MGLFWEMVVAFFGVLCLVGLGWWFFGRLFRPLPGPCATWVVVWARGDADDLEQRLRGLMWLRSWGHLPGPVLVVDQGLTAPGRDLACQLADRWGLRLLTLQEQQTKGE